MPPKRQPAKRKAAARGGDQDSDYSDRLLAVANKKAKRSERKPAKRSPHLHSENEGKSKKSGRTWRRRQSDEARDDYDDFSGKEGELEMLTQAALQRKTNQKEAKQSKEFLKSFQKRHEAEEKELAEFARGKMNDIERISKGFSKKFGSRYSDLIKKGSLVSQPGAELDSQPLHKEGQQVMSLCQEVLHHYKSIEKSGKSTDSRLEIRPDDQDKKDVLEIIDKGKQLGEKIINATVSPSAGGNPLTSSQSASVMDELVASFFEKSMSRAGENSWGKGAWGLWMALDKVVKGLHEGGV